MDQEGSNGRRRSSRLAARGIVTTPKADIVVKKTIKTSEKPKRSKRKTTEEIIELPEAKKTKTEDKTSSDEEKNETNNVENDISGISPMDVDNVETNVSPPSDEKKKDLPEIEEKTDVPLEDSEDQEVSKDEEVVEKLPVTNDEKDKDNTPVETEDNKSEITEEIITKKEPEITEQPKNDVSQDEPKQELVALENTNGKSDEKEITESEEIVNNDIGFCVTTKDDIVTPNGDTDEQVKSTNGDESITETVAKETFKMYYGDSNHVETDLKAVTTTTAITANKDAPIVEQVEKELDKAADNVVDTGVSADDNAPKVDQLSTVVS